MQEDDESEDMNAYNGNDDADDDGKTSVLDGELEAAVRLIEQDPLVNGHQYEFVVNNEQLCADSIHGGLAPGVCITRLSCVHNLISRFHNFFSSPVNWK